MRGDKWSADLANKVYDVLVEHAGASERGREDFVYSVGGGITEYRFQGGLGFGGKVWSDFRVSNYREDDTPERDAMREATNAALKRLEATL